MYQYGTMLISDYYNKTMVNIEILSELNIINFSNFNGELQTIILIFCKQIFKSM